MLQKIITSLLLLPMLVIAARNPEEFITKERLDTIANDIKLSLGRVRIEFDSEKFDSEKNKIAFLTEKKEYLIAKALLNVSEALHETHLEQDRKVENTPQLKEFLKQQNAIFGEMIDSEISLIRK